MGRITPGWANFRALRFGLPYGDQALLIHRDLMQSIGGYSQLPLMEDIETVLRLKGHLKGSPIMITTRADRYETVGWLRQGTRNMWRVFRYFLGYDSRNLAEENDRSVK